MRVLRAPEPGLVMLRGRVSGTGVPFNLGEATVCRCVVELRANDDPRAAAGVGYVLGRDGRRAELIAALDALAQLPAFTARVANDVIEPMGAEQAAQRAKALAQTATSKVEFFTMVRGES